MGVMYVVLGLSLATTPPLAAAPRGTAQYVLQHYATPVQLGITWILAGLIAVVVAFGRKSKIDMWGFGALMMVSSLWATASLFAAVAAEAWRGLFGATFLMCLCWAHYHASGVQEHGDHQCGST